jgi:hypothetical protein
LHETGQRDRYRGLLESAIDNAKRVLVAAADGRDALHEDDLVIEASWR